MIWPIKWFCRELVAVNPLHTVQVVLVVSKAQTFVQRKMALVPSGFRQFQCLKYSTYQRNGNSKNYNNGNNSNQEKEKSLELLKV